MLAFSYYNIKYEKHPVEKWVVASGEIRNETNKNYSTAVFRIKLYVDENCIGSAIIKICGFRAKSSKTFDVLIDGAHNKMIPKINRCEILFESSY
jgi:hypothetical protein